MRLLAYMDGLPDPVDVELCATMTSVAELKAACAESFGTGDSAGFDLWLRDGCCGGGGGDAQLLDLSCLCDGDAVVARATPDALARTARAWLAAAGRPTTLAGFRSAAAGGDVAACERYLLTGHAPGAAAAAAARAATPDALVLLLRSGGPAAATAAGDGGETAVHVACGGADAATAVLLLDHAGPSAVHARDGAGATPLHAAAARWRRRTCAMLVGRGACVDAVDDEGTTPLLAACGEEQAAWGVARDLLEAGADPTLADGCGETPLHAAASRGDAGLAEALLRKGACAAACDCDGETPLIRAATFAEDRRTVDVLLRASRARVDAASDCDQATALHRACDGGVLEVVRVLAEAGASLEALDSEERTPRMVAVEMGHVEAATLLDNVEAYRNAEECRRRRALPGCDTRFE